jgi:hypothetical protein
MSGQCIPHEVSLVADNELISLADSIGEARQRLALELGAQAEQIRKLNLELTQLQQLHERTEQEANRQWDEITRVAAVAAAAAASQVSHDKALEKVLGAVRGLLACAMPEQVFAVFTEQASGWGVRAAIFDVRGKAAWGASAHGFGPALSENAFRTLVIPLNQDNPFRQVFEAAAQVDASADTLKKNRNLLDKLKPAPHASVLLLPIQSGGAVAAILYADPGEGDTLLPVNALKILAEFAGAQIDRLVALSGGFAAEEVEEEEVEAPAPGEGGPGEVAAEEPAPAAPPAEEPVVEEFVLEETAAEAHTEVEVAEPFVPEPEPADPPVELAVETPKSVPPAVETEPAPPAVAPPVEEVPQTSPPIDVSPPAAVAESPAPPPPAPAAFDAAQISEAEQKVHRDAKRFARLLVSEIELYNKAKVADGRRNMDLYKRLKSDIDRSRQTYEKRFGKALNKQFDYFHDELVKSLAGNDLAVLGPEYPGPSA